MKKVILLLAVLFCFGLSAKAQNLVLKSFPSGAEVFIDGTDTTRQTPYNQGITAGQHTIEVVPPGTGWNSTSTTVTIPSGGAFNLTMVMIPTLTTGPQGPAGSFLPPIVIVDSPVTNLIGGNTVVGSTLTATITQTQLFALTLSADFNNNDNYSSCSATLVQNGVVTTKTLTFAATGSNGAPALASIEKTFFFLLQPGTYAWQLQYSVSSGSICNFENGSLVGQSYGAGSSLQSSGTF